MKTAPYLRSALFVLFGLVLAHHAHAQAPKLSIVSVGDQSFVLSWPATAAGYVLESVEKLDAATAWRAVAERPTLANAELQLVIIIKDSAQFFRLGFVPPPLPPGDFEIGGYVLISSTNISPTVYEDTYRAKVSNWGVADATVTASLTSTAPNITIVEGGLSFGEVPVGATIESSDTFNVRHDRSKPFDNAALVWTTQATPLSPTSFALIEKALADGLINAETALVYKVYLEFNDDRLPAPYLGRNVTFDEFGMLGVAESQFNTLSLPTQQLIAPFLLPPDVPGSWYALRAIRQSARPTNAMLAAMKTGSMTTASQPLLLAVASSSWTQDWQAVDGDPAKSKVRVWWDAGNNTTALQDGLDAIRIRDEIDSKIWPKLTTLLGYPLPDAGGEYQGGDNRLDIMLVNVPGAVTRSRIANCQVEVPTVISLGRGVYRLFPTVAHEFTHAILSGYKLQGGCGNFREYGWLHEATATWAEHFVYPTAFPATDPSLNIKYQNFEHRAAPWFLSRPEVELEKYEPENVNNPHQYGAYLWFLYLTRGVDAGAHFVKETWNSAEGTDSLRAIEAAIGSLGGFMEVWPKFVLRNWNRIDVGDQPYRDYYHWDKLDQRAIEGVTEAPILLGKASATYSLAHKIPHLAARYFHYDFTADNTIRSLTFTHPYWGGQESTAKVQAIVKIRDQEWKPAEDWTSLKEKFFCRDKPAEDVEELVIVISNSKFNDRTHVLTDINSTGGSPTELKISALGCSPWIGTASNSGLIDPIFGVSYTAQVTWSLDEIVDNVSIYKPSGAVTADFNGICTFAPKISDIDPATSGSLAIDYNTSPPTYRGSGGTGWLTTLTCPGPDGFSIPSAVTVMYFGGSAGEEFRARQAVGEVSPDGITIEGSGMEAGRTINWKFTRVQ